MSLVGKVKIPPELEKRYASFLETFDKLNSAQLEKIARTFLGKKGISIPRDFQHGKANDNYRLGMIAGILIGLEISKNVESHLLDEENFTRVTASVLAKDISSE